jgi:peptidoglycan/xylan/chitin deacetylase (PgdA/CDA1 family)
MNRESIYKLITFPGRKFSNLLDTPAVVLLYHRVCHLEFDPLELSVSPAYFADHLKWLKENYHVLSAQEFYRHLDEKKKFPKHSVLITFDDGYEDNFTNALPALEKEKLQALFFITTSTLGTNRENWWDDLERIVYHSSVKELKLDVNGQTIYRKLAGHVSRQNAYGDFHRLIKGQSLEQREQMFQQLHKQSGIPEEGRSSHRMMTVDQFKKFCSSSSAFIAAHTHMHASLSSFSYYDQLKDISISKNRIEELTGKKIEHFSYPFGTRKDFNADTVRAVKQAGLKSSFANIYGPVHAKSSTYNMHRMLVRNWPVDVFKRKMDGFFRY